MACQRRRTGSKTAMQAAFGTRGGHPPHARRPTHPPTHSTPPSHPPLWLLVGAHVGAGVRDLLLFQEQQHAGGEGACVHRAAPASVEGRGRGGGGPACTPRGRPAGGGTSGRHLPAAAVGNSHAASRPLRAAPSLLPCFTPCTVHILLCEHHALACRQLSLHARSTQSHAASCPSVRQAAPPHADSASLPAAVKQVMYQPINSHAASCPSCARPPSLGWPSTYASNSAPASGKGGGIELDNCRRRLLAGAANVCRPMIGRV